MGGKADVESTSTAVCSDPPQRPGVSIPMPASIGATRTAPRASSSRVEARVSPGFAREPWDWHGRKGPRNPLRKWFLSGPRDCSSSAHRVEAKKMAVSRPAWPARVGVSTPAKSVPDTQIQVFGLERGVSAPRAARQRRTRGRGQGTRTSCQGARFRGPMAPKGAKAGCLRQRGLDVGAPASGLLAEA